ncbi:hypothetical protein FJY68_14035 [candidate division WOR-3 bacterium]|uniref:PDZ domain-containing protein n=1 Tax=candidate division WOR-3 bacterium TaxID=2052148 RepID=A0A937XJ43_UNCW3|nr:hypothetical protein [candidate division WOR-3 bacterium]
MKTIVAAAFTVLLLSSASGMTPVEIKRAYGDAVVLITTYSAAEDAVGLGSGFIVDPSGVIVTCYHVIKGACPAVVRLLNGASFQDIWVLGCDSAKDVAVVKVKGRNLPSVKLARSEDIEVGESVIAIGNPRGLENTISDGLLSGVRELDSLNLLQISAPISPGSSGGPVFNSSGRVVGIASSTLTESQNLNFCVPIRYARPFIDLKPVLTLEDFARGIRQYTSCGAKPGSTPGLEQYLRDCVVPLCGIFSASVEYWAGLRLAKDAGADGAAGVLSFHLSFVQEKASRARKQLEALSPPDHALAVAQAGVADAARDLAEGADMMARALPGNVGYALDAGAAKIAEASRIDNLMPHIEAFARAYVVTPRAANDTTTRLPSAFDKLPAAFAIAAIRQMRDDSSRVVPHGIMDRAAASSLGFDTDPWQPGIMVLAVADGSPAKQAGIRKGDVLLGASNGKWEFRNLWDLYRFKASQPIGESFMLDVVRDNRTFQVPTALRRYKS